jgi:DNA-binding NarL/FixJ family response regulator
VRREPERTKAILRAIARGRTTREIAGELGYTPSTVATYVRAICEALGCHTRAGAVYRAIEIGILSPGAKRDD